MRRSVAADQLYRARPSPEGYLDGRSAAGVLQSFSSAHGAAGLKARITCANPSALSCHK
jgi:hypothetical protein